MNGAILILDYMPDMCINCMMSCYSDQSRPFCVAAKKHLDAFCWKPDWCPLIKLPNKELRSNIFDEYEDGWADGFNYLRSIILVEADEDE